MNTSTFSKNIIIRKILDFLKMERRWFRIATKIIWILFVASLLGFPTYIFSVSANMFGLYGGMPSLKAIENPENDLSSEIISSDGVSLGRYFRYNRSQVSYADLSPALVNTLLYSEDHRFHSHSGLDFPAFARVLYGILTFNAGAKGGGSTITQQLAKNLFTQNEEMELDGLLVRWFPGKYPRRVIDKTKEWIISVHLERNFTKEEIVAMYLNTANFSSNAYGIRVASETYFNKSPDSLNVLESAVLVGMLQAPTLYNPQLNPENSFKKRNEVLYKLYNHGYIKTREEYDSLRSAPTVLNYRVENQNVGLATYFRTVIRQDLLRWCKEHGYDLFDSGLKIYTTIDSRIQRYAEIAVEQRMAELQEDFNNHWKGGNPWIDDDWHEIKGFLDSRIRQTDTYKNLTNRYGQDSDSVQIMLRVKKPMRVFTWDGEKDTVFSSYDSLDYYKRFLHAGLMSIDAESGAIRAWVGGINHKYFKYDHVKQGKRQPGSTFKPFVYGLAMDLGYTPCHKMDDISPSFQLESGGTWMPPNSDGKYGTGERLTLRVAMARSVNSITAQLIKDIKAPNVVKFAHQVGITSKLDAVPSLCLGVSDVSLYELVGAYSTFVNEGIYTEPFYISRIEDKNGNVIENFVPKTRQAISEQTAWKMIYMLQGGVEEEGGTSRYINSELKKDNEIGGKTGTTNNASDGWYMGVTHNLVTGVWVGGDERSIHYKNWSMGQGSRTARPIWERFMLSIYRDPTLEYKKGTFKRPDSIGITLDCDKYETVPSDSLQVQDQSVWDIK